MVRALSKQLIPKNLQNDKSYELKVPTMNRLIKSVGKLFKIQMKNIQHLYKRLHLNDSIHINTMSTTWRGQSRLKRAKEPMKLKLQDLANVANKN